MTAERHQSGSFSGGLGALAGAAASDRMVAAGPGDAASPALPLRVRTSLSTDLQCSGVCVITVAFSHVQRKNTTDLSNLRLLAGSVDAAKRRPRRSGRRGRVAGGARHQSRAETSLAARCLGAEML